METEDQHKSRLAEEAQKEARLKAEAADKEKKEKEKVEKEKEKAEHKQENLMKGSLTSHPPPPPSQLGSHSFTPFVHRIMIQTMVRPDHLNIRDKCRTVTVLAHKAVKMAVLQ
jgi:hypothetical protein